MHTTKLSIGSAELTQAGILGPWYQPGMWLSVLEGMLTPDQSSEYKLGWGSMSQSSSTFRKTSGASQECRHANIVLGFVSPVTRVWECVAYALHPWALDFYMTTVWMLSHCLKEHDSMMWSIPSSVLSVWLVFIHMCPWVLLNLFLEHLNSHVCQVLPYSTLFHFGLVCFVGLFFFFFCFCYFSMINNA